MYQLSVCPSLFLSVNAKIALPFFTASFRSASSDCREVLIASKAADEGKESGEVHLISIVPLIGKVENSVPDFRDIVSWGGGIDGAYQVAMYVVERVSGILVEAEARR